MGKQIPISRELAERGARVHEAGSVERRTTADLFAKAIRSFDQVQAVEQEAVDKELDERAAEKSSEMVLAEESDL